MSINSVVIMGRLTADPELRKTPAGKSVLTFTVAVDNGKEQAPAWIDCVAWESTADFVSKYFRKGKLIAVEGRLQTRNYEDKQGNKRKAMEVVCNAYNGVSFCGDKDDAQQPARGTQPDFGGNASDYEDMQFSEVDDDGFLPF